MQTLHLGQMDRRLISVYNYTRFSSRPCSRLLCGMSERRICRAHSFPLPCMPLSQGECLTPVPISQQDSNLRALRTYIWLVCRFPYGLLRSHSLTICPDSGMRYEIIGSLPIGSRNRTSTFAAPALSVEICLRRDSNPLAAPHAGCRSPQ